MTTAHRALAGACAAVLLAAALVIVTRPQVAPCTGPAMLDLACHAGRYERLTRLRGPAVALADLETVRAGSGLVRAACHQVTHVIGRAAGAGRGDLGPRGFAAPRALCSAGYQHGLVEAAMAARGARRAVAAVDALCAPVAAPQRYSADHFNCAHGLGHGLMGVLASDVPGALAGCDRLADGWERQHCASGVFMENISALGHPERPSRFLQPGEPLYPCADVAGRHRAACYERQTAYALHVAGGDFGAVFALCAGIDAAYRSACDQGLGGKAAAEANKRGAGSPRVVQALCLAAADEVAQVDCVAGAAHTMIRDYGGVDDAAALCASLARRDLATACRAVSGLGATTAAFCQLRPTIGEGR